MRPGRIILLNGTSSSGKTTLLRALQDRLPDPWIEVGIDRFVFALPKRYLNQPLWSQVFRYVPTPGGRTDQFTIETGPLGERLVSGMHRTAAALAEEVDTSRLSPEEAARRISDALDDQRAGSDLARGVK